MLNLLPPGTYNYSETKNNLIVNVNGSKLMLPKLGFASCITCARFNNEETEKNICEAYPTGIPAEIMQGKDRHLKSNGDDNGLFYLPTKRRKRH